MLSARLLRRRAALEAATSAFEAEAVPGGRRAASRGPRPRRARSTGSTTCSTSPTAIGERVDTATEATYRALTSPVIKGVAIASGTAAAHGSAQGRRDARPRGDLLAGSGRPA